ncbi:Toxin subunit YenA2-like protein [Cladobotryum mycophilum]|uniref:Toxin subunit YenA2-like protein n=1 Tax=Cladobotryum mycophilum TaxID=491253 RepID=A0ABR0S8Y0_9HYPO
MSQLADRIHLEDIFKTLLPPNGSRELLGGVLPETANSQTLIQQAIEKYSPSLQDDDKSKLLLLADLVNRLQLPLELCKEVILHSDCLDIEAVIAQFWEGWHADRKRRNNATRVFEAESALITKALVTQGRFKLPPTLRDDVVKILEHLAPTVNLLKEALPPDHEAIVWLNELNDPARKQAALSFLVSVQKLCRVIVEPLDLPVLMSLGFSSSEQIAYTPLETFKALLAPHGISTEHAKRIHAEAASVQMRVEQSLMTLLQDSHQSLTPRVLKGPQPSSPSSSENTSISARFLNTLESRRGNLSSWFGDLDQVSCDDCCSVTSPAAYLVDLFRLLKNIPASFSSDNNANAPTLLDKLFDRRPDLGDLLLSCRNTSELVPYIDLVNETLESAVVYLQGRDAVESFKLTAFDADSHLHTHEATQLPQDAVNIRHEIYDEIISKKVYPSIVFPYDHSKDSLQKYLRASGATPAKLLATFRSNSRLALDDAFNQLVKDQDAVDLVYGRAYAAEVLGMSQSDYVAVTLESFYDLHSARLVHNENLSREEYQKLAGLLPPWYYWGYEDSGRDTLLDATDGNGLPFIKKQLLPRLSVDFSALVQILKTRFLGGSLTVSLIPEGEALDPEKNVPTQLEGFRLRGKDGQPLEMNSCQKLDQFARVWRRLGWEIDAVDDAICALADSQIEKQNEQPTFTITPTTIEKLAAVTELVDLAESKPERVVSLFSLTSRHLLNLPIVQAMLAQSVRDSATNETNHNVSLSVYETEYYLSLLLISLNLSYDDYLLIQETEQLGEELSIASIFTYNRLAEASRMFSVTVAEVQQLLAIISGDTPAFASPQAFVYALKTWKRLKTEGWSVSNLISVSTRLYVQATEDPEAPTLEFITGLLKSIRSVKIALSSTSTPQQVSRTSGKPPALPAPSGNIAGQSILAAIRDLFPDVSPDTIEILLKKPFGGKPTLMSLIDPVTRASPISHKDVDFTGALFVAEDTIIHLQTSLKTETETTFTIGNVRYDLVKKNEDGIYECIIPVAAGSVIYLSWPSNFFDTRVSLHLPNGQPYTTEPHPMTTEAVLDVQHAIDQILQYSILLERYPLNGPELDILSELAFTVHGFGILHGLQSYTSSRQTLARPRRQTDFARFVQRLIRYEEFPADFASQFSQVTILSKTMAEKLLRNNLPDAKLVGQDLKPRLEAVRKIGQQIQLIADMGLKEDSLELLFILAQPPRFGSNGQPLLERRQRPETRLVRLLRAALVSKELKDALKTTQDSLRNSRRRALIHYLLQHPALKAQDVVDEDSLFEIFLIDVQMGAGLETTRIKQAISTVQLFVHRSLLGMEKGIEASLIPQERWEWVSKYNLWEANRKVFLYPENWAEPTLRDNKTELFRSIEESVMQHNLDDEAVNRIIRSYAHSADHIANLEMQAFYWDKDEEVIKEGTGSFHFVARTRNAPYEYYYRRLDHILESGVPTTFWGDWQMLPFEIHSYEADHNGQALKEKGAYVVPVMWGKRLIIFLPQISVVPVTQEGGSSKVSVQMDPPGNVQEMEVSGGTSSTLGTNLEIAMAWSELIDGVWSAQQQSPDVHVIAGRDQPPPAFESFRFLVEHTEEQASVLLYREMLRKDEEARYDYLGRYELRGSRLSLVDQRPVAGQLVSQFYSALHLKPWIVFPPIRSWFFNGLTALVDSHKTDMNPFACVFELRYPTGLHHEPWFVPPKDILPFVTGRYDFAINSAQLFNSISGALRVAISTDDTVESLYKVMENATITVFDTSQIVEAQYNHVFGRYGSLLQCREDATPAAIYNWELGFHLISMLVERLMSLQAFELAIKYAHLVFNPTGTGSPKPTDSEAPWSPMWRFPPFRDGETLRRGTLDAIMDRLEPSTGSEDSMAYEIVAWRRNPFKPHTVARGRPLAYMKRFIIKYMEALIESGDVYFRQNSLETIHLAIQRYIEASHIFGPAPETVPELGKQNFKSYKDLEEKFNDFSNASVDLELSFPYFVPLSQRGLSQDGSDALQSFVLTPYFCTQANPEFLALRHKIDDRLFKIRNSLDINGNPRTLSLWDPPLNVGNLVAAAASSTRSDIALIISGFPKVMPKQKFTYLLKKSYELCEELKETSAKLLSIIEKEDREALQLLHSSHETGMQRIVLEIKLEQKREAEKGLEQLEETRKSAIMRLQYYAAVTGDDVAIPTPTTDFEEVEQNIPKPTKDDLRLMPQEVLELKHVDESTYYTNLAILMDRLAASFFAVPMPEINTQPFGIGMSIDVPHIGQAFEGIAYNHRVRADKAASDSETAAAIGRWTTRLQERRLQLNLAGREIKSIDKQIETQAARITAIEKEIELQNKTAENLLKVQDFLTTKFSSKELYAWYENSTRTYLYQTYLVTMELVRRVEAAYLFDIGPTARSNLASNGYWDQGKRGLQCGEQLWFALKQMELAYLNESRHDFEMTKTFPLTTIDPHALISIREIGEAIIDFPEILFDLEFPGHYFRRFKSVGFSFIGENKSHVPVNCTATLLDHRYRANGSPGGSYPEQSGGKDPRFVYQDFSSPITSVAMTSGQDDTGRFEVNFSGDAYLPFEGAGVISRWKLRLPNDFPQFDFQTISDVLIKVSYTAKNGGDMLYAAAVKGIRDTLLETARLSQKHNLQVCVALHVDNSPHWNQFSDDSNTGTDGMRIMEVQNIQERLPYFVRRSTIKIIAATIYVKGPDLTNCKFSLSPNRESSITDPVLEYAGRLGNAQLFQTMAGARSNSGLDIAHRSTVPWFLKLQSPDGKLPLAPACLYVNFSYALAV